MVLSSTASTNSSTITASVSFGGYSCPSHTCIWAAVLGSTSPISGFSTLRHNMAKMGTTKLTIRNRNSGAMSPMARILAQRSARFSLTLSGTPSTVKMSLGGAPLPVGKTVATRAAPAHATSSARQSSGCQPMVRVCPTSSAGASRERGTLTMKSSCRQTSTRTRTWSPM